MGSTAKKLQFLCLECYETKEYAKIFCEIFERVSFKNFFFNIKYLNFLSIFPLEPNLFLSSKSSILGFSCFKHVKMPRMQFF